MPGEGLAGAQLADWVEVFKALSDPIRMNLFLRIADVDEIACTQIVLDAKVTASTVSYHVKILKAAGLVDVRKEGRNFFYTARASTVAELASALEDFSRRVVTPVAA
jgi:ArsR family transcriptional regulator, arsenate/arsenite/antimonite-responsive transcriptional repressor